MQEIDFRAWLPVRETPQEKRARVRIERKEADEALKIRMLETAAYYRVPLRMIYKKSLAKYFPHYHEIRMQLHKEEDMTVKMKSSHCIKVDEHGEVEGTSKALGQKLPSKFVRSTALASWRVRRFHKDLEEQCNPGAKPNESCNFRDFLNKITDVVIRVKQKEAQMAGLSRAGSFFLLSPYEKNQFRNKVKESFLKERPLGQTFRRVLDPHAVEKFVEKENKLRLEARKNRGKTTQPEKGKAAPTPPRQPDAGTEPRDTGTKQRDTGTEQGDTGTEPRDTATEQGDTATEQGDTATEQGDTATEQGDTGTEPPESASETA